MDEDFSQKAINAALSGDWANASKINLSILAEDPTNTDAMNRLAMSYFQMGKTKLALEMCKKVLKLDPLNTIAEKNLPRYKATKRTPHQHHLVANGDTFLELPGQTKIVTLTNLGDRQIIQQISPGDEAKFVCHTHKVCVTDENTKYIGRLPDDLAARMRSLIRGGNRYSVLIKSCDEKSVKVFIKELKKSSKFANTVSFPVEKLAFSPVNTTDLPTSSSADDES